MKSKTVRLPKRVAIELMLGPGKEFLGLGTVSIRGVPLRSPQRPLSVHLDTPDGILYTRLLLQGVEPGADGEVRVRLEAVGQPWPRSEYFDDYGQATVCLRADAAPVHDELVLVLKPVALELGGRNWTGFSYAFEFASATRRIHRLLTHATWEIGGSITGNTLLHQGQCNMPVYQGSRDALFTSACLRTLDQYGSPQGNSFQLGPRAGLLQAFDFQYSDAGALFQFWPDFESISSLIESPPGCDLLHVIDEYRFELTERVTTTPKCVLFTPGPLAEHETRDLWWEAHELAYGRMRTRFGVAPTIVRPDAAMRYRTRVVDGGRLRMTVCGEEVDSTEVPYLVGDKLLPKLAAQGVRRFFPEVMSESDVTQLGMKRKCDNGIHGDLHCSSVCATHRFFPAEFWGGIKAWKYMADKAHALGIEIGAWFAPHLSPRTPIYEQHPEYRMIDVCGFPAGGGYGFQTIAVADWNTGVYDWVLNDMRRWREEGGLDYLFIDSYSNMGMLQTNYAARMRTNYAAFARLLADLQGLGIKAFTFESISPFGASRFGLADLRGDLMEQNRSVAGQNDFGWWVGHEDMAWNVTLCASPRKRTEEELERILFRTLAQRGYVQFEGMVDQMHDLAPWWAKLNAVYNRAVPFMADARRRLLPAGAGVTWEAPQGRVVWTFAESAIPVPRGATLETLDDGPALPAAVGSSVTLPPWRVVRVCLPQA